mgnify:CR=1 FL=1
MLLARLLPERLIRALRSTPALLLAGVLQTAAFAPSPAWWAQPVSLAWLFWAQQGQRPRRAAWLGACFGSGWLASGLWWLYISLHDHGHLPAPLAVAAVLLLAAFLSLYYALALGLAARWLGPSQRGWRAALVLAACWTGAELARATLWTGFPWLAGGYAHAAGPLAVLAPWVGVYGLGALAALLAAALSQRCWRLLAGLALVLLACQWLPADFTRPTGELAVSLVQPNVPQDQKFDRERWDRNLDELATLIESARGQVVITPESVVPLPLAYLDPDVVARLQRAAAQRPLLLGSFLGDEQRGFVNSLVALGTAEPYDYGKRHLLPFGEFIPPGFGWFVRALQIPLGDQARGQHQDALALGGQRLRPLICYEDLFGEDFVASALEGSAASATVLVNASNLAWFGEEVAIHQHLQIARLRSLEFQRPTIRSTNTGATVVIDHRGVMTDALTTNTQGVLRAQVQGTSGLTPFARWAGPWGLWPLIGLAVVLVIVVTRRPAS